MSELRWNPLLRTWTMVAANRKLRPTMPKDGCPFCPGAGKQVPDSYDVYVYDNDFPVLSLLAPGGASNMKGSEGGEIYRVAEAYGKCEVILYSPEHEAKFHELSELHITRLLDVLSERFDTLKTDPRIKYIFPFENKGAEVGVTMPHPHGQLYAYPFVPLKIRTELEACREHYEETGRCLFEDIYEAEREDGRRMIAETEHTVAYIPFFTDYPYGVFVMPKRQVGALSDCTSDEKRDLATVLKRVTGAFDRLFDRPFPYMAVYHQVPVNASEYADANTYYRFHIEFYPPLREADKIKYYASSEMGAWAAANTAEVEVTAEELREKYEEISLMYCHDAEQQ